MVRTFWCEVSACPLAHFAWAHQKIALRRFPVDFCAYFILRTRDGWGDGALRHFGAGSISCAAHNPWPQKKENKTHAPNKPCAPHPYLSHSSTQKQKREPRGVVANGLPP